MNNDEDPPDPFPQSGWVWSGHETMDVPSLLMRRAQPQ